MENYVLKFNINKGKKTDDAFVHITAKGAKVCLHFPQLRFGERIERFSSYEEAEKEALKINAKMNNLEIEDVYLVSVDTSIYPIDKKGIAGVMTGCFTIRNHQGKLLETVYYEPEDRIVAREAHLGLTDVAEIKTAIYMFNYLKKHDYENAIVNYDNIKIASVLKGNINLFSKTEQVLINKLRGSKNSVAGEIILQHYKSHVGHHNLDYVDKLAKRKNEQVSKIKQLTK